MGSAAAARSAAIRGPAIRGPAIRGPAIRGSAIRGPGSAPSDEPPPALGKSFMGWSLVSFPTLTSSYLSTSIRIYYSH
jgi:hypothetical protein